MFHFLTFDIFLTTWHFFDNLTSFWYFDTFNLNHLSPHRAIFYLIEVLIQYVWTVKGHYEYANVLWKRMDGVSVDGCHKCICFCFLHFVLQNFFLCVMACNISSYIVYSVHNKCKYVNISEVITTLIRQNMISIRLFFCSASTHRLGKVHALQKFRTHYDIYNDALQCPVTHYEKCGAFLSCAWRMTTLCAWRCINMAGSAQLCFNYDGIL